MKPINVKGFDNQHAISKSFVGYGAWEIHQIRIEAEFEEIRISMRGENTMWFNANDCYIGTQIEMEFLLETLNRKKAIESLNFQYIA